MLQRIFALLALFTLSAAYLSYEHLRPWVTFNSEMLSCLAALLALASLSMGATLAKLPLRFVPLFALAAVPLLQYAGGIILFKGVALLHFAYLALFASMVVVGYNLCLQTESRQQYLQKFCWMLLLTGLLSSGIAIVQWLQLEQHFAYMMGLSSNRPYANFAQPNNFCTFAIMALLATLYLTERRHLPIALAALSALVLLFAIVLTQSRTAWITLPIIVAFWVYAQRRSNAFVQKRYLGLGLCLFVLLILALPTLNQLMNQQLGIAAIQTASAAARASAGHERLTMWQQMFAAMSQQPWLGYGWGRVAAAQAQVLSDIPLRIWFNSSHNLLLDVLVMNGLPLGGLIILFMSWWLWQLQKLARSPEASIALLMVVAILIHAMLEYPQRYAYFLLPMGFLLGVVQAHQAHLRQLTLPKYLPMITAICGLGLWGLIWRDYSLGINNIKAARVLDKQRLQLSAPQYDQPQLFIAPNRIYVLDQFAQTAQWVSLNPFVRVDDAQLKVYAELVVLAPSRKNLVKYAQLLAYNGHEQEAKRQLKHLYILYKVELPYNELLLRNR